MSQEPTYINTFMQQFTRALSFSERTLRSTSAVLVGTSTLLTETLLPKTLRQTNIYKVTLGMFQQFVIEKVAEMEREPDEASFAAQEGYVPRKMVGTALEAAGLVTVGFSPLWVFAILSDGVGGSKVYLERLVQQLKQDGLIDESTEINEVIDLFTAVQNASGRSALALDMPPLTRDDFATLTEDMQTGYGEVFDTSSAMLPTLDSLWASMEQVAKRENISLDRLAGIMTMDAMKRGVGVAAAAGKSGADLFNETVIASYRETLENLRSEGVDHYIADHMRPFLDAARGQFDTGKSTWIERNFSE